MGDALKERLAGMKKNWQENKAKAGSAFGGNTVPAGTYIFKLSQSRIGETQSGKLMWFLEHTVVEGDHKGETVFNSLNLEHEVGMQVTAQFVDQMGYECPDDPTELPDLANTLATQAPTYKASVKYNKDGYASVRVMELLDSGEAVEESEPEADEPEEEAEEVAEVNPDLSSAIEFCLANGIDVNDGDDLDTIKATIGEYELMETDLSADEIALLERIGCGDQIKRLPKKTAKATPAAKKKGK